MRAAGDRGGWARMLLQIGEGRYLKDENDFIELPSALYSQEDFIREVFGETIAVDDIVELADKTILAPKTSM
ncbi:unnamed protein product [Haemonchus placei]|uniref:ABC transporter ATP-binding protein n=1 Tax=Haemonchus placei TaxID=6290 RepID=A0A0N4W637_HAEPC|nr:unnamed protein product [Haemonchus placei]